ncbi:MAG: nitroreductase family protein [Planctomycetota bacterium]|jgi:nitroreductase
MDLTELLTLNRSYRRFHEDQPLDEETLKGLVEKTRLCPSSANRQPLKYLIACSGEDRAKIFPHLAWAGALRDWPGPAEGQRPAGYIVILGDLEISSTFHVDSGIAAQSMLLSAVEQGLGGCMIGSIKRDALRKALKIPDRFAIALVIALGKPKETVALEDAKSPTDVVYWRDEEDVHHVPKRPLEELLVEF